MKLGWKHDEEINMQELKTKKRRFPPHERISRVPHHPVVTRTEEAEGTK